MLAELAELVGRESPSSDVSLCRSAAALVADQADRYGVPARVVESGGRPHVLLGALGTGGSWSADPVPGQVLLLGHLDTVWPEGTAASWPFAVADGVARGPGAYDMKAGIVQGVHALASLASRGAAERAGMLVTSDEETGSAAARGVLEPLARSADAVLVLEPGPVNGVKVARKGSRLERVLVQGRAAHSGLEPEKGVNACVEVARLVLALDAMHDPESGRSVVPTLLSAGSAENVVPERAELTVDVRSFDPSDLDGFEHAVRSLGTAHPDARVSVECVSSRPPLLESSGAGLFARAREIASALGLGDLTRARVGGVSDGNLAAAVGAPTLDGLGPVGGGAHARSEHVLTGQTWRRAALVAALVASLAATPARIDATG
ncbi:MAG: M20/M25/M40 family metallo-hydrolase [Actinomycetota bacterium]|nr:M20/M25/M40 family metallo-hydrolase [Actinomycetota bacterium]